ncbi:MAG: riboflavin synthase [Polynucleobacter sp.]|jgi:riboflavin synthase|nr:riboflavin synthase [Polynucleobacter sp.]
MFTGIITAIGQIETIEPHGDGFHIQVRTPPMYLDDLLLGDSIAVQGACMTITHRSTGASSYFEFDISKESISKTVALKQGDPVNLEKALRLSDRLGGHLVSGHIDGMGKVISFSAVPANTMASSGDDGSWSLEIEAADDLSKYLAYKGSIVVNGVSLTVNQVQPKGKTCIFKINIIPHTLEKTTLRNLKAGDAVNLEVDLIARYVARLLEKE